MTSFLSQQKGSSLVLSVLLITALTGIVISIANTTLRIIKSTQSISGSEVAFYAAESAAEWTVYDIVKNYLGRPDLAQLENQPLQGISGATWGREVIFATTTPSVCSAPQAKQVCSNNPGTISTSNNLEVTLNNNESFQMDLNLAGAVYHDRVNISWSGGSSGIQVLIASVNGQTVETSSPVKVPSPPATLQPSDNYRFRIINASGGTKVFTIKPQGAANVDLPLGLDIMTVGNYLSSERSLEITHPAWLIY